MNDSQVPILPTDEDNQEERQEKLAGDFTRPYSLPDDVKSTVGDDNEMFDSMDVDTQQAYDEGASNAAEVNDPGDRGVRAYKPKRYTEPQHGPVIMRKSIKEEKS
jgi:hypothetical protein